jgi:hypothetical protein
MSQRQFLKENGDVECERCEAAANDRLKQVRTSERHKDVRARKAIDGTYAP